MKINKDVVRLESILDRIEFENKAKYHVTVEEAVGLQIKLCIKRSLICTTTKQPRWIHNDVRFPFNITNDQFVKTLFRQLGQFEAHEFMESFKVFGRHAYFPHENDTVKGWYGSGETINSIMLDSWKFIADDLSTWQIAKYYLKLTAKKAWHKALEASGYYETKAAVEKFTHLINVKVRYVFIPRLMYKWGLFKKWGASKAFYGPSTATMGTIILEPITWAKLDGQKIRLLPQTDTQNSTVKITVPAIYADKISRQEKT